MAHQPHPPDLVANGEQIPDLDDGAGVDAFAEMMDLDGVDIDSMDLDQDLDEYGEPGSDIVGDNDGDKIMAYPDDLLEQEEMMDAPELLPRPAVPSVPRRHGYATVEVHGHAARVIRWEYLDDEPTEPDTGDFLRQRELFLVAEWLARLPISDNLRAEYLSLEMHQRNLPVPWRTLDDYYKSVDSLEHGPDWSYDTVTICTDEGEETFIVYKRCPLQVALHLIALERLKDHIRYAPEKHWTTTIDGRRIRVYSETWTGDWWWRMQDLLGEDAMIIPIILASDQTHLTTLSGSKVAWPVYMTIGNIEKAIRRRPSENAMLLIGYIPVAKLAWITNEEERRMKRWELYHACMAKIVESLRAAADSGVEVRCADGGVRQGYPVLAGHIADWPEMCTAGCTQVTRCPICLTRFQERGHLGAPAQLRTKIETLQALRLNRRGYADM